MYNAFRSAVATDPSFAQLYNNIDVGAVFDSWIQTPGSPVLNVDVNTDTGLITITQVPTFSSVFVFVFVTNILWTRKLFSIYKLSYHHRYGWHKTEPFDTFGGGLR